MTEQMNSKTGSVISQIIAGSVAGAASICVGHPLDTLKTRLQLSSAAKYKGPVDCFLKIIREEGPMALYRGIIPPLLSSSAINAVSFASYVGALHLLVDDKSGNDEVVQEKATHLQRFSAGFLAAFPQAMILCPTDLIKIRLQQDSTQFCNVFDCIVKSVKSGGIGSLYQGMTITLMRDMPALGAYFASYHYSKNLMIEKFKSSEVLTSFVAGAIAGAASWIVVYPLDAVKTTVQSLSASSTEKSIGKVLSNIFNNIEPGVPSSVRGKTPWIRGINNLYRGLGITIIRSVPVNAIIFPAYELTLNFLNKGVDKFQ